MKACFSSKGCMLGTAPPATEPFPCSLLPVSNQYNSNTTVHGTTRNFINPNDIVVSDGCGFLTNSSEGQSGRVDQHLGLSNSRDIYADFN
jgi:hypothetical protein